jgi:hypothetical protein
MTPVTSTALFKARTECCRMNNGIVGSSPTRGVDVCPHIFFFRSFPVYAKALRWAGPPSQEPYQMSVIIVTEANYKYIYYPDHVNRIVEGYADVAM